MEDNNLAYSTFDPLDASLQPMTRVRANTWHGSQQQNNEPQAFYPNHLTPCEEGGSASSSYNNLLIPTPADDILVEQDESSDQQDDLSPQSASKKNSSRRNAWGNHSYADLITQAIQQSPDKRLTLSQIYEWMVQNVEYFKDKGDSNSSAGWKNSIRHNLSLHSRFTRVQNDGAGKSSWWMINPDAKPGKGARRRANSMETKTLEKKKNRLRKKNQLPMMNASSLPGGSHSLLENTHSPCSSISENVDQYPDSPANQILCTGQMLNQHVQAHSNQLNAHHTQSSANAQNGSPVYHQLNSLQPANQTMIYGQAVNNSNCLIGQINSPDRQFRTRTASNASSSGRFSPLEEGGHVTSLAPLNNMPTNGQWTNTSPSMSNGYVQLDMDSCPNELMGMRNLSLNGLSEPNLQTNTNNNQFNNNGASYMNNNMFIGAGNPMFTDDASYMNRNQQQQAAQQQMKLNNSMCKTPQNSMNNSMNNLNNMNNNMNNLNQLNQQNQAINEDSLLSSMSDCFGSSNLMSNSNQLTMDNFFQNDYPQDGLFNDLNCDSNNPNDDENNNRIFSLSNLSSNNMLANTSTNQASHQASSNYNTNIRYDQRANGSYGVTNQRIMFNQNVSMYQNNAGSHLSNGQQMLGAYNQTIPSDLDPSLYSQTSELDCDIDSVINKELSLDGTLDFNDFDLPHSTSSKTSTNNTIAQNPATQSCVH